jgi:hypothetical protein
MSSQRKTDFFDTEEGIKIIEKLRIMALDQDFNTDSSYSANSVLYPDNQIPFVEKHMRYLITHPAMDPDHYLANLRLMTRRR